MSVTVISEQEPQKSEATPSGDTSSQVIELGMAARFGEMTESNRQLQEKLSKLELQYEQAISSHTSTVSELSSLRNQINSLEERLAEPIEEATTDTISVTPPNPSPAPAEPEKPKKTRTVLQKILYGR